MEMLFTYIQPCKARQNDREAQEALGAGCKIVTTSEHGVCKSFHRNHLRQCHSSLTRHFRGASDRAIERERVGMVVQNGAVESASMSVLRVVSGTRSPFPGRSPDRAIDKDA